MTPSSTKWLRDASSGRRTNTNESMPLPMSSRRLDASPNPSFDNKYPKSCSPPCPRTCVAGTTGPPRRSFSTASMGSTSAGSSKVTVVSFRSQHTIGKDGSKGDSRDDRRVDTCAGRLPPTASERRSPDQAAMFRWTVVTPLTRSPLAMRSVEPGGYRPQRHRVRLRCGEGRPVLPAPSPSRHTPQPRSPSRTPDGDAVANCDRRTVNRTDVPAVSLENADRLRSTPAATAVTGRPSVSTERRVDG